MREKTGSERKTSRFFVEKVIIIKNILSILLAFTILFSALPVVAATDYDEVGAYLECCTLYPDFIGKIKNEGITDKQLMTFVKSVEDKVLAQGVELTEENFDSLMFTAFKEAFKMRKNIKVRDALAKVYPESASEAMYGVITEEFMPIYITVKRFLLGIKTPIVTLSGTAENTAVHHVHMPDDAVIIVAFYNEEGSLLHSHINPAEPIKCDCKNVKYAKAFAFKGNTISPLCESFTQKF